MNPRVISLATCLVLAMTAFVSAEEPAGVVRIQKQGQVTVQTAAPQPGVQPTNFLEPLAEAQEEALERMSGPPTPYRRASHRRAMRGEMTETVYDATMLDDTFVAGTDMCDCDSCRRARGLRGHRLFGHHGGGHLGGHGDCDSCDGCDGLGGYLKCKFGFLCPDGNGGAGMPLFGKYSRVYPNDPSYFDGRDGQVYGAQGYGTPVSVPLAPVVGHTYNYGWGVPSSRLTPVSHPQY